MIYERQDVPIGHMASLNFNDLSSFKDVEHLDRVYIPDTTRPLTDTKNVKYYTGFALSHCF